MKDEEITKFYLNPENPGSLGGLTALKRELKRLNYDITDADLNRWSKSQPIFHRNQYVKKIYKRCKTKVAGIDDTWQIDLIDMLKYKNVNNGYAYILTCIDVFSKYAWAIPIKSKEAISAHAALVEIFKEKRKPKKIHSDKGTEFLNELVLTFLKKNNIKHYTTESDKKASVVERFNNTLKRKIWHHFSKIESETKIDSFVYIDVLNKLVKSYNKSFHSTIRMAPINVTKELESKIWKKMYGYNKKSGPEDQVNIKFDIGDYVRYQIDKGIFEKGYTIAWYYEIFIVRTILFTVPPRYLLKDLNEEDILGSFYDHQLTKVNLDDTYNFNQVENEKKIIESAVNNVTQVNKIACILCNKEFTEGPSMVAHLRWCKKKNKNI
jgi:hypothetical protein